MIRVFLCNSNTIILEGLHSFVNGLADIEVVGVKSNSEKLLIEITKSTPDVVIIDYSSEFFDLSDVKSIKTIFPNIQIVGITDYKNKDVYETALSYGLKGHILNCCDRKEVIDAIRAVYQGESFFCGKVLGVINESDKKINNLPCTPVLLSERELEIIALVAEGLTNKEIAQKIFLSAHTVTTHRKNIMSKLGITNTASLVLYAVKQQLISPNKFLFETTP